MPDDAGSIKATRQKGMDTLQAVHQGMWAATVAILIYTTFIVWLLEHQSNTQCRGPWYHQLGSTFSFVYTSLLFSHREKIHSGYTRLVVLVWLFLSLIISSSYTASLSSMLTVSKLEPNVKDVDWLKRHNANVACDGIGENFISRYLVDILLFSPKNIKFVGHEYDYPNEFKIGNISAAFVELPYGKAFLKKYNCKDYHVVELPDKFGGFGFAFQKGSPIVADFSTAILTLQQNGRLKQLEEEWYAPPKECLAPQTTSDTASLSLQSFWGLYLFSAITSTLCYLLFAVRRYYKRCLGAKVADATVATDGQI